MFETSARARAGHWAQAIKIWAVIFALRTLLGVIKACYQVQYSNLSIVLR